MAQKSTRRGLKSKYVDYLGNLIIDGKIRQDILNLTKTRINYLRPKLETKLDNGVTCTNNGDGTYTLNGTSAGGSQFVLEKYNFKENKQYKLVGTPPVSNKKTYLYIQDKGSDFGGGYIFNSTENKQINIGIWVADGYTCDNLVFKPMLIDDLSATYDDFVSGFDSLTPDIKMDLLWTNANPTSTFTPQTVTLDLSKYNFVYFVTYKRSNSPSLHGSKLIKIGESGQILTNIGGLSYREVNEVNENGVIFGSGMSNDTSNNDYGVPLYIYGVR